MPKSRRLNGSTAKVATNTPENPGHQQVGPPLVDTLVNSDFCGTALNVIIALALPLIAHSRTISSFGSRNCGRHIKRRLTGIARKRMASTKFSASVREIPAARKCSGVVHLASYSKAIATLTRICICLSSAARNRAADAPDGLRIAAMITSVSSTIFSIDHIICNVTYLVKLFFNFPARCRSSVIFATRRKRRYNQRRK